MVLHPLARPALWVELCVDQLGAPLEALLAAMYSLVIVKRRLPLDYALEEIVELLDRYARTRPLVTLPEAETLLVEASAGADSQSLRARIEQIQSRLR